MALVEGEADGWVLDAFLVGAGGGFCSVGGGLEGVTGSSPGKDCFCCSGVSAEREREMEPAAESRRAETSVTSGSSDSLKWTGLWLRYSHFPLSGGFIKFD
jgi:hypothetical protein